MMVSLILPFLRFVTQCQEHVQSEISSSVDFQAAIAELKNVVVSLFEKNIILEACLTGIVDQEVSEIFKVYLSLQNGLLKGSNERLKSLFINSANEKLFSGA